MRIGKSCGFLNFFGIFYILQVATTQKLQRFTVNGCVVICGVTAVLLPIYTNVVYFPTIKFSYYVKRNVRVCMYWVVTIF